MIKKRVWQDQAEFNTQLRPAPPQTHDELAAVTKEFTLHQMTEMAEFLDAGKVFGQHRRRAVSYINRENVRRQLIDQLKYWMSIAQAWGFTLEELERTYWSKSATVRQRFAEEWITELDKPLAIIDLDGVLCDYIAGFRLWLVDNLNQYARGDDEIAAWWQGVDRTMAGNMFLSSETVGIPLDRWQLMQHDFRASGGFAQLPAMPYAADFLAWCRHRSLAVVVLTSRPIDEYPNLYDDTVQWFANNKVTADRIWWGPHKGEKLATIENLPQVQFAVDDDPRYVQQLVMAGLPRVYWHQQWASPLEFTHERCVKVQRLEEICATENQR